MVGRIYSKANADRYGPCDADCTEVKMNLNAANLEEKKEDST